MVMMVVVENCDSQEKEYFLSTFKNILFRRCQDFIVYLNKISFMQNSHETLKANHSSIY